MAERTHETSGLSPHADSALASGNWRSVLKSTLDARSVGESRIAARASLFLAARFRNVPRLRLILRDPASDILRSDMASHRELALALFYAGELDSSIIELQAILARADCDDSLKAEIANLLLRARNIPRQTSAPNEPGAVDLVIQKLPIISLSVNDLPDEPFIVDTGAATTLLSRQYADRNSISLISGVADESEGKSRNQIPFCYCKIRSLTITEIQVGPSLAAVTDFPHERKVAGLFSPFYAFYGTWWELDFRAQKLRVYGGAEFQRRSISEMQRVSLYWDRGNAFVCATLNNIYRGFFMLDTGAGANIVTEDFAADAGLHCKNSRVQTVDIKGLTALKSLGAQLVQVGVSTDPGDQFETYLTQYQPLYRDIAPIQCAGFLGMDWFSNKRIMVPPNQKHMFFQTA